MRVVLVFLLIVCLGVPVHTIKEDLLAQIVKKFQDKAKCHAVKNKGMQPNQISFILFIPDCESQNSLNSIGLEKNIYIKELNEFHEWFTAHPKDRPYYLCTGPDKKINKNKRCSEYKILFDKVQSESSPQPTYAEWIAKVSNNGGVTPEGSCVVFYTTNTPCTKKCFSDTNKKRYIVDKLLDEPFSTWKEQGAKLVFVFMKVYDNDYDNNKFDIIKTCFNKMVPKWEIYNCSNDQNQSSCKRCDDFKDCDLKLVVGKKRSASLSSEHESSIANKKNNINQG